MSDISVIIPTYNERENIGGIIEILKKNIPPVEIIVVDDDSPDRTWQLVEEMRLNHSSLKLIRRFRRGLASAIREGIYSAGGTIIAWLDSDFSMPPAIINKLIECINNGYDVAVASRYIEEGVDARDVKFRQWASRFINKCAKYVLNSSINDLTSGFIASKRAVVDKIDIRGYYGEYCIDFLFRAEKLGLKIKEIPYKCLPRLRGRTKTSSNILRFLILGTRYLITILKLKINNKNEKR